MNTLMHKMDLSMRMVDGIKQYRYFSLFIQEQYELLQKIMSGEKYVYASYYIPSEIMALIDQPVLYTERLCGFAAANKIVHDLGKKRKSLNFPPCGCSYQLLFECMVQEGIIPLPSVILVASYACDDAWQYGLYAGKKYNIPVYSIDVMKTQSYESIEYLSRQLNEMIQRLWPDCINSASIAEITSTFNATENEKALLDMDRFQYPGIINSKEIFKIFTVYNDFGRKSALNIIKVMRESIKQAVPYFEKPDCPKIGWLGVIPLYQNNIIIDIENKYSCRIVYEELFDYGRCSLEEDRFFICSAERIHQSIFFTAEKRVKNIQKRIRDYQLGGVIHISQKNCRFLPPMAFMLEECLDMQGIPYVNIDCDVVNPEHFNKENLWNDLDKFFETIYAVKE